MAISQTQHAHIGGRGRRGARGAAYRSRRGAARTALHPARRSRIARSGVDHGGHHPQPRQHDLRPAVRSGREFPAASADGRGPQGRERRPDLGADAARRSALPRRREGARARLRRVHPALGPARRIRQRDDEPDGRGVGAVGSCHPHPAEEAVRAGACRTGAAELRDHAGAHRQDRCQRADHRSDRQRAVPVPDRGARPGFAQRLREVRRLCAAAGGHDQLPRRSAHRAFRPRGVDVPARSRDLGRGAEQGRIRLVGESADRPRRHAARQQGTSPSM